MACTMIEVTQDNFNHLYPSIAFAIGNASFISLDTEFSGLHMNDQVKPSLFDSSIERYEKLRKSVTYFSLLQMGLTVFDGNTAENRYNATIYNFNLHPASLCSLNPNLNFQVSGIDFLSKHNFDFNQCFKQGMSYMNCKQEQQLIEEFKQGFQEHETHSHDFEEEMQKICSLVASWICNEKTEQFFTLSLDKEATAITFISIQNELRKRFCEIWTSTSQFHQIIVQRVTAERRQILEEGNKEKEEEDKKRLVDALGFTQIFRLLQGCKVPLIGHNMFMDLLFMYDKFHNPLPRSFTKFKQDIHEMFPLIFDTKHIHHCMKLKENFEILKSQTRTLQDLHSVVNGQKFVGLAFMHPSIHIVANESEDKIQNAPHHAGYDSYLCGTVFIRFCHVLHFYTRQHLLEMQTSSFTDYLPTMKKYANCVNVIRATINYINLNGEEPKSKRPPLLHVSSNSSKKPFTPTQLSSWFSVHGTVDIRMIDSSHAVVATSNYMTARDILYSFKCHPIISVTRYKFWQHSPLGKVLWWTSFLVASGSCLYVVWDTFRQ